MDARVVLSSPSHALACLSVCAFIYLPSGVGPGGGWEIEAAELPRSVTLTVKRTIACINAPGAADQTSERTLSFQLHFDPQGTIFDFDSGASDRGVEYRADGREHAFAKTSAVGRAKVRSTGTARATWTGNILQLEERHAYKGPGAAGRPIENQVSNQSVYTIDAAAGSCSTRSVGFHRLYVEGGIVQTDVTCARLVAQSCTMRDGR